MGSENIIVIDGGKYDFNPGDTILQVAERNGIDIPTLCYLKGASPTGACRICVVEVEGRSDLPPACATPAESGLVVRSESPRVVEARRFNLELLLASGQHNCLAQDLDLDSWTDFQLGSMGAAEHKDVCPAYGVCRLQDLALRYRVRGSRFAQAPVLDPIENVNPFIVRDFSRCILCGRCVAACNQVQVNNVISFGDDGTESKVVTQGDKTLKDSDCVFCGECVQACPVGALVPKRDFEGGHFPLETKQVRTTCSYCGVGCQLYLHVRDNRIVRVSGVEDVGPNYGSLCVKGRFGYDFVGHADRLTRPLIRENGRLREAEWDEALDLVRDRLGDIKAKHGPDALALFASARITNEDNYLAQKFFRAAVKTNNIDHCARL